MQSTEALAASPKPMRIGERLCGGSQQPMASRNPASGAVNHYFHAAGASEIAQAVQAAEQAFSDRHWRHMAVAARGSLLRKLGDLLDRHAPELATLQMQENGKTYRQCLAQAKSAAATYRYYAAVCETLPSEMPPARGAYLSMVMHEPYGVVGAITPWNSPLTLEAQKIAPALAAGNAVVLKPSELTPSPALAVAEIALEAGLPPGILNVVPGSGSVAGSALIGHPGVRMITFTGGTSTGRRIAEAAAARLVPAALELGGKSPHIICADADLDRATAAVVDGIFDGTGQSCVAGSRVFVERAIYEQALERIVAITGRMRVGAPDDPDADMGPLASFEQRQRVEDIVEQARSDGACLLTGGRRPADPALLNGAYYEPTVITGLDNRARAVREEIFGPVVCVLPFEDDEDLIAQANDTVYGLAAGIWSSDFGRAWNLARRLEAGTVWINTYKQLSIATPFGGYKESGLGREKGTDGMRLYQQVKGIYVGLAAGGRTSR